jgi:hypothetical protein
MGLINQTQQDYYDSDDFGGYQFSSLNSIINQFMIAYVGEDKLISKVKRLDVSFHAKRALQELSFDTLKSFKSQEITLPATLQMPLPQDYVNYKNISFVDSAGIKHLLYPTSKTSNPPTPYQNADGDFKLIVSGTLVNGNYEIILDKYYPEIQIGDVVTGPNVGSWVVSQNSPDTGGIFLVSTLVGFPIVPTFQSTLDITETLTITKPSGDIRYKRTSITTPIQTGLVFTGGSPILTFDSAEDASGIEVGMVMGGDTTSIIGVSPTVIGVNGKYVTISNNAAYTTANPAPFTFSKITEDSTTWSNYKSHAPSENNANDYQDYQNDIYWPNEGGRYGLDPQHSQVNGSFYIDEISGKIHFSSNISGKTVILDYISDSLGTDGEMQVHKFAEEAIYKWMAYAILSTRPNIPEYIVQRYKKERFAETRKAKLRLSNIKLEEITQIFRGKSKQIKH